MTHARPTSTIAAGIAIFAIELLTAASPGSAQSLQRVPTHLAATLIPESAGEPGETINLAIDMRPQPGWHGYWRNPGDAGIRFQIKWTGAAKAINPDLQFPVPTAHLFYGMMNHIYRAEYAMIARFTVPRNARPGGHIPIVGVASWLACSETMCVPEQARISAIVSVSNAPGVQRDPRFARWLAALPLPSKGPAVFSVENRTLKIAVPVREDQRIESPHLFLASGHVADYPAKQHFRRTSDYLLIDLPITRSGFARPKSIDAVVRLNPSGDGISMTAEPGKTPSGGIDINQYRTTSKAGHQHPYHNIVAGSAVLVMLNIGYRLRRRIFALSKSIRPVWRKIATWGNIRNLLVPNVK